MGQKLKLDFSGVETFQRASEGIHTVKVATAEVSQSSGGNDMITVAFEVTKGADKGARVYENFPLVDKALWKLKGFLQAIGMKADGKVQLDVDKLLGKVCNINVIHEEWDGKLRARCESIMKFSADDADDDDEEFMNEAEDEEEAEEEAEEEKKPAKKPAKPAKKAEPEDSDDDNDDDWDDDDDDSSDEDEDEEPVKEEKPKKAAKKEEKPKKETKKPKKEEADDDWDDDDDWDE